MLILHDRHPHRRLREIPAGCSIVLQTKIVETTAAGDEGDHKSSWDRLRRLSQTEKILFAVKADRAERAVLIQDNDPRVLLSVLRNPRLTVDEVVRIARSSFLKLSAASDDRAPAAR